MAVTEAAFHLEPMAIPSLAPAEQALGHQLGLEHPMPMALAAMAAMAPEVAPAMPTGPALAMAAMAAMPMAMVPMLAVFRLVASEDVVSLLVALGDVGSPPVALEAHKLRHPPVGRPSKGLYCVPASQQLQLFATLVWMKTRHITNMIIY